MTVNTLVELVQTVPALYIRGVDEDRALIERALALEGSYSFGDVKYAVEQGLMQHWPLPHSVVISEIITFPNVVVFHIFLAAGKMQELRGALPELLAWGKSRGCTEARINGRPGWARSFLTKEGWNIAPMVQLTKDL